MKKLNRSQFNKSPTVRLTDQQKREMVAGQGIRATYVAKSKYVPTLEDAKCGRRQ